MSSGEMRGHIKKINDKLEKINGRLKAIDEIIEEQPVLIIRQLSKLDVKEGDVLLVKSRMPLSQEAARNIPETLKELIKKAGMPECKIVIMEDIELEIMRKGEEEPAEEKNEEFPEDDSLLETAP